MGKSGISVIVFKYAGWRIASDQDLLNLGIKAYTQSDIDNAANKDTIEDAKKYLIGAPKVWPRMRSFL